MNRLTRFMSATGLAIAAVGISVAPANASSRDSFGSDSGHAVFVQNDSVSGNQVIAYDRSPDGTLTQAGVYPTDGLGGVLTGSMVDHLASQGSLTFDRRHGLLFAVNAGSNTVSVFAVHGDRLFLRQLLPSGGTFPVSVAVHGNLVYVLNARDGGSVQGYRTFFGVVLPLPHSNRSLGLPAVTTPEFVSTPGQVAFSPDGSQLLVTTKADGSAIDVFGVRHDGRLSAAPVVNVEPGAVPFAVDFDAAGHVVVTQAGANAVATFSLASNGVLTAIDAKPTGQNATCWVVQANGRFYASNAGSGSLSSFASSPSGLLTAVGQTATDAGTVDATATPDQRYVYVQAGAAGIVDEFRVNPDGSLTPIGSVERSGRGRRRGHRRRLTVRAAPCRWAGRRTRRLQHGARMVDTENADGHRSPRASPGTDPGAPDRVYHRCAVATQHGGASARRAESSARDQRLLRRAAAGERVGARPPRVVCRSDARGVAVAHRLATGRIGDDVAAAHRGASAERGGEEDGEHEADCTNDHQDHPDDVDVHSRHRGVDRPGQDRSGCEEHETETDTHDLPPGLRETRDVAISYPEANLTKPYAPTRCETDFAVVRTTCHGERRGRGLPVARCYGSDLRLAGTGLPPRLELRDRCIHVVPPMD